MKYFLSLLISFSLCGLLHSQDTVPVQELQNSFLLAKDDTSRINALRKIGNFYYGVKPDSAIYFTSKALALAEKINWTKGIAQNCLNLGNCFIYISKYDSAIYYETRALQAANIVGDKNRIALIYINRGAAYTETQQFEKAMPDLMEAMHISEETGNKDRQTRASQGICELYIYQSNLDAALPWGEKTLQLAQELDNKEMQGTAEMSLSGIYMQKGDLKRAENLLLDAIPKSRAAHKTDVVMSAAINLSEIYNQTHQYPKALQVLKEALNEGKYTNEVDQLSSLYSSMGNTYLHTGRPNEAVAAYKQGYEMVKNRIEFQQRQYANLLGMSNAYAKLGDFKDAYESERLASILKDSVSEKVSNERLLKLQTQFETERKEKEIALLKKDQQLHKTELQEERTVKISAFILSGLLIVIGFLAINRYRVIHKAKRMIEIEKLRNNIARDLHDDIGSALSSININSKMALNNPVGETVMRDQLEKIRNNSGRIMENMSDIVWAISPANDSVQNLIIKMKEFTAEILDPLHINYTFNESPDLGGLKISVERRKEIYLVFKEAVNNAAKYSGCRQVNIDLVYDKHNLVLKISDDGKGFNTQNIRPGNGLYNMRQRSSAMGAVFDISSETGKGTSVMLDLAIT